ncbi:MAG: NAD(P)-dependent oxidoreductase [Alphaproteobacteria bacterium]
MTRRIGLVGMGLMGQAFIKHLHEHQYIVQGFDPDPARMDQLAAAGGHPVDTPAAAAKDVDRLIISVPTSDVARTVIFEDGNGIAGAASDDLIIMDTTTARPVDTERTAAELKERGIRYLDSTVSGTSTMAQAGDLVVIVGGEEADFEACREAFAGFSRAAYYMGPSGSGARTKLIINMILAGNRFVFAEGLVMGQKAGLDSDNLLAVLQDGACSSKTMVDKGPKMIDADYSQQGKVAISLKDARLMMEMGQQLGAPAMVIQQYAQIMQAALEKGYSQKDTVAFFEILRGMAGLEEREGIDDVPFGK